MVKYLQSRGWPFAERRALQGALDTGDINLSPGAPVIEVKDHKTLSLAQFVDEATAEAINARAPFGVAWIKRRGKSSPGEWYVVMSGDTFATILGDLGY